MVIYPVFAILDDRTLSVYASLEEVQRDLEVIDIDAGEYAFFDARGRALRPDVIPPVFSKHGRFIGIGGGELKGFDIGDGPPLIERLSGVFHINDNSYFPDVPTIVSFLTRP
ncbi:hypothetical protein [Asticcacaulis excentricus]|uniref:hypothetical protein n=1 Tax=Asticcacaulis excentricus TaxID=78587 RepID=UPI000F84A014|nr:hypothetical protein [Asticcacaulis excentricus]